MNIRILGVAVLAASLAFTGCSKKSDEEINTKSMAQIHAEEGVPVNVKSLKPANFRYILTYDSAVNGIKESTASAKIDDSVEKIHFSVGDQVKKDDVIVSFPKNNPAANYYQLKTSYENAKATFDRMSALFKAQGISKQDYDNAKTQYEVSLANWNNVKEKIDVIAPISGTLTRMNVTETDDVKSGDVLFAVSDISRLKSRIWIQEKDISSVKLGDTATATWEGNFIEGKIVQLDLAMNPDKQAFGAVIEFINNGTTIPSGVNAKITLVTYEKQNIVVLERKNIIFQGEKAFVFLAQDNKAVRKQIVTGKNFKDQVEIISGLKFGDALITDGNRNISDGTTIRVIDQE